MRTDASSHSSEPLWASSPPGSPPPRASAPPLPNAKRRHEAEPRRLLDPTRGLREAHPDVPEDAGRQGRRLHPVLWRVGRAGARGQGRARRRHRRALARSGHRRARRAPNSSTRSGRSSPSRAWSRTPSSSSSCATATRRRSRAGTTSCRPDVEVVTPNPFTSGGARWNIMAAYGSWRKQGKTDKQAQANLLKLFKNVVVQDTSARASLNTFNSGKGDVLLAYENEAYFSRDAGPRPPVGHPEDDDPHREPDRGHEGHRGQGGGERVPALPEDAGGPAGLRGLRLPTGGEERREREPQEVPGAARPVHDRPARPRRLGEGAEAVLRPEDGRHGAHPAAGRR